MLGSLTLCFVAVSAKLMRSAPRRVATIFSTLNRLFLMGSSQFESRLPRSYWTEEAGQVTLASAFWRVPRPKDADSWADRCIVARSNHL